MDTFPQNTDMHTKTNETEAMHSDTGAIDFMTNQPTSPENYGVGRADSTSGYGVGTNMESSTRMDTDTGAASATSASMSEQFSRGLEQMKAMGGQARNLAMRNRQPLMLLAGGLLGLYAAGLVRRSGMAQGIRDIMVGRRMIADGEALVERGRSKLSLRQLKSKMVEEDK